MSILIDRDGPYIEHDPEDITPIGFTWTDWLASMGENTIDTITWTAPTGMTKVSDLQDGDSTDALISGGTAGETYRWECKITAGAKTKVKSLRVKIRDA